MIVIPGHAKRGVRRMTVRTYGSQPCGASSKPANSKAGATVQPWCVQMALKATAVSAEGRATMIGLHCESWAETAEPTGMLDSVASALPEPPDPSELDPPPDEELLPVEPLDPEPPPPQAASNIAQPTPVPASSIRRSTPRA